MFLRLLRARLSAVAAANRLVSIEAIAVDKKKPLKRQQQSTGKNRSSDVAVGQDTLGRRLLSLVYDKRSAVITISKWKEEGRTVRKYELNRIIRELRKFARFKHALEICEWMQLQNDIKLQPGDYAVHLDLIAKVRGVTSAEKFFEDLPDNMRGHQACTSLLFTYVQNKLSDKAEALLQKMAECGFLKNALPYNHMLNLYIAIGQLEKVPEMIQELKKNTSPDVFTYNLWLTACASQNDLETAENVFLELKKKKIVSDWVTYSLMTKLYVKNGFREKAASTLEEMEKRCSKQSRPSFSSLLSLQASLKDKSEVHRIWTKMKSLFRKMNDAEYATMMSALVKLGELNAADSLYTEWESVSKPRDFKVANILLAGYINADQVEKAENFYNRVIKTDNNYTTLELLTWGYLKTNQFEKSLEYFKKAVSCVKQWNPNENLVREIWKAIEDRANIAEAEELLDFLRKAGHVSTEIYNSLLRTYAKAEKMPVIISERMRKDNVSLDEDTHDLIKLTSTMCVNEIPVRLF
ncbi:hypothetical protein ACFE04_030403 [Oxalis oulophora]